MKQLLIFVLLILAFLSAAKSHGRQHRLERQLEGHWNVSFTAKNHPWVETFWFRQRVLYWTIASASAVLLIVLRNRFLLNKSEKWQWFLFIVFTIAGSMIAAFIATGLLSWARFAMKLSGNPPGLDWLENVHWVSFGWWLLTALLTSLLIRVLQSAISNLKS